MKNKVKKISNPQLIDLTKPYITMVSGATLVHPKYYPVEFQTIGINPRDQKNNDFWGTIITKPNDDELVFGFVYFDKKEKKENEDLYSLNFIKKELISFMRGSYERLNPVYRGTHKGLKDFLNPNNKP